MDAMVTRYIEMFFLILVTVIYMVENHKWKPKWSPSMYLSFFQP